MCRHLTFSAGYDPPSPPEKPVPLRPPRQAFRVAKDIASSRGHVLLPAGDKLHDEPLFAVGPLVTCVSGSPDPLVRLDVLPPFDCPRPPVPYLDRCGRCAHAPCFVRGALAEWRRFASCAGTQWL